MTKLTINQYDIWLAYVPFEDSNKAKARPILILSQSSNLVTVAKITSHLPSLNYVGEYSIINWSKAGLNRQSTIRLSKVVDLSKSKLIKKFGHLSELDTININKLLNNERDETLNNKNTYLNLMFEDNEISNIAAARRSALNEIKSVKLPNSNNTDAVNKFYDDLYNAAINVSDKDLSLLLLDEVDYCKASNISPERTLRSLIRKITNHNFNESVMTPTPIPYDARFENKEAQPLVCFALFDKDNKPLLNSKGVIITSKMSDTFNQDYANSLYGLMNNADQIYAIDNDVFDKTSDIKDDTDFYKFVKDNGKLLKNTNTDSAFKLNGEVENTLFDDTDFVIK